MPALVPVAEGTKRISEFEFYIPLTFAMPIFEITDRLSTQLQEKTVSTGHGVQLMRQAIEELNKLRSEEKFAELWTMQNHEDAA